jgi:hypothetical protein
MKDEARKLLTEFLGGCWHETVYQETICFNKKQRTYFDCSCGLKGRYDPCENRTFTTPDDMMAVKEKLVEKGLFDKFDDYAFQSWRVNGSVYGVKSYAAWLIHPARFCELAVHFGKEVLGWKT